MSFLIPHLVELLEYDLRPLVDDLAQKSIDLQDSQFMDITYVDTQITHIFFDAQFNFVIYTIDSSNFVN